MMCVERRSPTYHQRASHPQLFPPSGNSLDCCAIYKRKRMLKMREAVYVSGQEGYGKSLYHPSLNFAVR